MVVDTLAAMTRALVIAAMLLGTGCGPAAPPAAQPAKGACPEAYLAVGDDDQVRIYQVTTGCTVVLRNTLAVAAEHLQWPNVRAALVLFASQPDEPGGPPVLRQKVIASPLTARAFDDRWEVITFGEPDPEGAIAWGAISDERYAYAIGCADWEQGEEEWTCAPIEYRRDDGERSEVTPVPQFARAIAAGPIADGVELVEVDGTLHCRHGDELVDVTPIAGKLVATAPRFGERYFAYHEMPGTRTSPEPGFMLTAMHGCHQDATAKGWFLPGPGGLVAHALVEEDEASLTHLYAGDRPEPLLAEDGQPFATTGELAWAAP